jgi:hypothetical protein
MCDGACTAGNKGRPWALCQSDGSWYVGSGFGSLCEENSESRFQHDGCDSQQVVDYAWWHGAHMHDAFSLSEKSAMCCQGGTVLHTVLHTVLQDRSCICPTRCSNHRKCDSWPTTLTPCTVGLLNSTAGRSEARHAVHAQAAFVDQPGGVSIYSVDTYLLLPHTQHVIPPPHHLQTHGSPSFGIAKWGSSTLQTVAMVTPAPPLQHASQTAVGDLWLAAAHAEVRSLIAISCWPYAVSIAIPPRGVAGPMALMLWLDSGV